MASYTLTWPQRDDQLQPVPPGYYYVELGDIYYGRGSSLSFRRFELLIEYPQGAMEKDIDVEQSRTITGLPFVWRNGETTIDLTIILRRVDLSAEGTEIGVWVTSAQNPLSSFQTWPREVKAQYSVDGVIKETSNLGTNPGKNGMSLRWNVDPVPSDAKEFILTILNVGDWEGPWEFRVALNN